MHRASHANQKAVQPKAQLSDSEIPEERQAMFPLCLFALSLMAQADQHHSLCQRDAALLLPDKVMTTA